MPTLPPPIIALSFREQVCKWLSEMHLQFGVKLNGAFTAHIEIENNNGRSLNIVLIDLENWLQNGSSESWHTVINDLLHRRNNGETWVMIWEDYWIKKPEIVKSRLSAMLGISQKIAARLTQVRRIDQETASQFLAKNHLNASVSSKTRFGLFLPKQYFRVLDPDFEWDREADELLVAVATFSAPRVFAREDGPFRSFEMLRFASLINTNVSGGMDKLLTAFARAKSPDDIMTYADREWSEGAGYVKIGFKRISETLPMEFYLSAKNPERTSTPAPDSVVIYNAGSIKFVKTIKTQN
ncbi:hypothetical protein MUK70_06585 [Dyadobacter chenwenxiniae]|uniref:Uncharacterized protein n=1 Tax=Dyadobacter chenwenxiniae TaxID=2906456 RepID=A0A9X1PNC9_9BACT|nr:hypothetical protein [Dyadobacter chenwenxiniae]MCF0063179.1 hypothetical protein [Dyadobacter chenwenxiniae]UON84653.1 hypothetical protein MUK70_06585 [Dyadobacter chenwenxiniae]